MTKVHIAEQADALRIDIDEVGADKARVLEALQECAEGRCSCPTSQYERLAAIEITPGTDGVAITLTPKAGETIDRAAIDRCLDYTVAKGEGGKP